MGAWLSFISVVHVFYLESVDVQTGQSQMQVSVSAKEQGREIKSCASIVFRGPHLCVSRDFSLEIGETWRDRDCGHPHSEYMLSVVELNVHDNMVRSVELETIYAYRMIVVTGITVLV